MIEFRKVTKRFDNRAALDELSLEIPKGSAFGLIGSNGAGKSTLLRLATGIYRADSGEVLVDGQSIYDNAAQKEKIFFVNDETAQYNRMTLKEMADFCALFYSSFSRERFGGLVSALKLPEDKRISTFSKGMKRQAAVICGIAAQPDFLLLDEAFDGLDPAMRIIVKRMVVDAMLDNSMTVVISSHNLGEIDEFCDRAALLHEGKIVFCRELDSVKGDIHKIQTSFAQPVTREDFAGTDILHFEANGSVIYIIARGSREQLMAELGKKNPLLLDILPLTLEEVFLYEMEGLGYDSSYGK